MYFRVTITQKRQTIEKHNIILFTIKIINIKTPISIIEKEKTIKPLSMVLHATSVIKIFMHSSNEIDSIRLSID